MAKDGEQSDVAGRKGLLTLDQQNSSSDIFISISGLIGMDFAACFFAYPPLGVTRIYYIYIFIYFRSRENNPRYQTGREDGATLLLRTGNRQHVSRRLLQRSKEIQFPASGSYGGR